MALDLPISVAYPRRTVRSQRSGGDRFSRHWLEMSLVVQGACPPNITWPKLPLLLSGAGVRTVSIRGVTLPLGGFVSSCLAC